MKKEKWVKISHASFHVEVLGEERKNETQNKWNKGNKKHIIRNQ